MGRYASETIVPVERSKAEIEGILTRYGASEFISGWGPSKAMIGFRLKELFIRFILPIPDKNEKQFTHKKDRRGYYSKLTDIQAEQAWNQELRQRWRALLLVVKAKLEAVECGISSLEQEFLAFIVLPGDLTVGEWMISNALPSLRLGKMPQALLPHEEIEDAEVLPYREKKAEGQYCTISMKAKRSN